MTPVRNIQIVKLTKNLIFCETNLLIYRLTWIYSQNTKNKFTDVRVKMHEYFMAVLLTTVDDSFRIFKRFSFH